MSDTIVKPTRQTLRNALLRALPDDVLDRIWPQLEWAAVPVRTILQRVDEPVGAVHFVEQGLVSMIATLENGDQSEVGLVGREGVVGLSLFLGAETASVEGLVQVEGSSFRMSAAAFRQAVADHPAFTATLLRYVDSFMVQLAQGAVCNGHHQIEQRLARWLLMTHDRVGGTTFTMTQQFISYMLGVQRPSVTLAVGALQQAGLVRHGRGKMELLDRPGLEALSCECYGVVRRRFAWLIPDTPRTPEPQAGPGTARGSAAPGNPLATVR